MALDYALSNRVYRGLTCGFNALKEDREKYGNAY